MSSERFMLRDLSSVIAVAAHGGQGLKNRSLKESWTDHYPDVMTPTSFHHASETQQLEEPALTADADSHPRSQPYANPEHISGPRL